MDRHTGLGQASSRKNQAQLVAMRPTSESLVQFLMRPDTYPHAPAEVELRETHISWVFLAGPDVYKLKKPVRFEFLDYSTPLARRRMCLAELQLNRRLAKDTYLDVLPITFGPRGLELNGTGEPIDWVVHMQRLPLELTLDRLILEQRLKPAQLDRLAQRLARFYASAPPLTISWDTHRAQVEQHIQANRAELLRPRPQISAEQVQRIHAAQLRFLHWHASLLQERVCDGRIVEGHGDLRPEHICLLPEPAIFDCVEFSEDFRRIDVADELSFLGLECEALGAPEVGEEIWNVYQRRSGDRPAPHLRDFYKSYRACVRAKVAALRADQAPDLDAAQPALAQAKQYLELAERHARELGPHCLIVVRGLMGSGKSTLAEQLAQRLGLELLQTDQIRRQQWGPSPRANGFNEGIYQPAARQAVYDQLFAKAEKILADGGSVVVDGTFLQAAWREQAVALAKRHGAVPLLVQCVCPPEIAQQRIRSRKAQPGTLSEARPELYSQQLAAEDPSPRGWDEIELDTTPRPEEVLERALETLAERYASFAMK